MAQLGVGEKRKKKGAIKKGEERGTNHSSLGRRWRIFRFSSGSPPLILPPKEEEEDPFEFHLGAHSLYLFLPPSSPFFPWWSKSDAAEKEEGAGNLLDQPSSSFLSAFQTPPTRKRKIETLPKDKTPPRPFPPSLCNQHLFLLL